MSDLAIKEIEDIYNKKRNSITRQEKEKYKAWADDGFVYILSDLALKIIMDCRTPIVVEFRFKLGLSQDNIIMTKEQSVLTKIMKVFSKEEILLQYSVSKYRIDLYFIEYKVAVEVDERGHKDRNEDEEERKK